MRIKAKGHHLYIAPRPKQTLEDGIEIISPKLVIDGTTGLARTNINAGQYKYSLPNDLTAKDLTSYKIKPTSHNANINAPQEQN